MNRLYLTLIAALAMVACTQPDMDETPQGGKTSAKIINTSSNAAQGSLLVKLDSYATEFSVEDIDGITIEACPLFPAGKATDEQLRGEEIYRWWRLSFDEAANLDTIANRVAADSRVKIVEYNELLECIDADAKSEPRESHSITRATSNDMPFNDEYLCEQWHFYNDGKVYDGIGYEEAPHKAGADINLLPAWKYCTGDPRVIVAVIDSGVKYSHPDLAANMWVNEAEKNGTAGEDDDGNGYTDDVYGYNFFDDNGTIVYEEHGTHVAGIIGAVTNNGIGVAGIAGGSGNNDGCRIMTCQINKTTGISTAQAPTDRVAAAMKYAADNGAVIMNNSWVSGKGGAWESDYWYYRSYSVLIDATKYFENNAKCEGLIDGGISIFAAGNNSSGTPSYPGAYYNNICVTSFGPDFQAGSYTNYGTGANICAPGGENEGWYSNIASTGTQYDTDYMYGTSQAAPHVSGCAALGLAYALKLGKQFTGEEYRDLILTSVHDIDQYQTDSKYKGKLGAGYIDAHLLLMQVEGTACIYIATGKQQSVSLDNHFGDGSERLTYLNVEMSATEMAKLGITTTPTIVDGKLQIKCTKSGTARMSITAIVGGTVVGGGDNMGGMEVTREFEVVARQKIAENGGWL